MSTDEWTPKDVFISYRREERPRVLQIAHALEKFGLTVWFDAALEPGSTFDEEIAREISSARAVLVCWSKAAVSSRWVRSEAMLAAGRRILIPVFLESCELLPPFNLDHAEDLSDWSGGSNHSGWLKILSRIGALAGRNDALVRWAAAETRETAETYREFLKRFPADSLAAAAKRRVWDIELAATRQRLAGELGLLPSEEPASQQLKELTERLERAEAHALDAELRHARAEAQARTAEEDRAKAQELAARMEHAEARARDSEQRCAQAEAQARTVEQAQARSRELADRLERAEARAREAEQRCAEAQPRTVADDRAKGEELAARLERAEARAREAEERNVQTEMRAREAESVFRSHPVHDSQVAGTAVKRTVVPAPVDDISSPTVAWDNPTPDESNSRLGWWLVAFAVLPLALLVFGLILASR